MMKNLFLSLSLLFITVAFASAQTGTVKGIITDSEKLPLIGANVIIKGTTTGTITDIDGKFQLTGVPVGKQIIVASFIGYLSEESEIEVNANQTLTIDFGLVEDVTTLEELVVVGYGTQKKEDKTGAVASVKASELNGGVLTDPLMALTGKAAGVVVTKGGGDPNADSKIKIRGSAGISGKTDTNPLYVIDGIAGADPNMIAPEDIESYSILKDAASTAIYGSRGANGVIIITTKRGSFDNSKIDFSITSSFDQVSKRLDLYGADNYRSTADQYFPNNWTDGGANTDWQEEIFRTGVSTNYNLGVSGGNEKNSYFGSVTHSNWQGVIENSGKERTIGKVNLVHKGLNDKLTITGSLSAAFEKNSLVNYTGGDRENVLYQAYQRNPTDPVYNSDGTLSLVPISGSRGFNYINPVGIIELIDKNDTRKKFLGNVRADYEITKGLIAAVNFGYINRDKEYRYYRPVGVFGGQGQDDGEASRWYESDIQTSVEATLNYDKSINDMHNLNLLGGYSWQENDFSKFGITVQNSQSPTVDYDNLQSFIRIQYGNAQSEAKMSRLIGFFGRANYNFDNKYYIAGSLRYDGSSKFGSEEKWGVFPTASVAWNMHREDFMNQLNWLSQFKLRASYGVSGNQAFDPYFSQTLYYPSVIVIDPVTGREVLTWDAKRNANPNLKWERTTELNAGIDFGFLGNKLSGSFEFYNKVTDNLLNEYSVSQGQYRFDKLWANSGVVLNQGVELYLTFFAIDKTNLDWKTSVGLSRNKGKVTELGEYWVPETDGRKGWLSGDGMVGGDNWTIFIEEDQPLGNFLLYEFASIENGAALYKNNVKADASEPDYLLATDARLTTEDRKILGNATPKLEISWTNNMTIYKNWTFDFSLRSLVGQKVYNHTKGYFTSPSHMPNRNLMVDSEEYRAQGFNGTFTKPSDQFLENGSFLRLDYVALGYNFKFKTDKYIKNLKLSVSSNNLFVLTKYSGSDPEMTIDGLDYGVDNFNYYPKTRTISFGLNATF